MTEENTTPTAALTPEELVAREIVDELNASFRFKDSHVESVGDYGEPVWVPNPAVVDIIAAAIRQHSEAQRAEIERLTAALKKIDAVRNSIVAFQKVNFSEHVYPLVAALDEAGFEGMGYPAAVKYYGSMMDRTNAAEAALAASQEREMVMREYVTATEFWKLEPHDQKERAAFMQRIAALQPQETADER